jgi:2-aminobenzoate-CoA ligase
MTSGHADTFVRDRLPPADAQPEFLFDLPELQYPELLNAAVELIDKGDPEQLAVINDAGSWTYGAMAELSGRISRLLVEEEGLIPGNRVLLRGPNTAMLFAAWLGVLKAGGVAVTTMPVLRSGEIATILQRAEISHAIVDSRGAEDYHAGAKQAGTVGSTLLFEGDDSKCAFASRLAKVATGFVPVATGRDDPALIAFTSGTTGQPKACIHYHRDILAPADSFAQNIVKPRPGDRWACSAPIAFTFGLGMLLIFPWRSGGTAVTIETPGPEPLLSAIARHKVTILATAPTAYKAMLGSLDREQIASLSRCISAGEHLPEATWKAWHSATGIPIIDGIGATEMMHVFISASGNDIRPGATGLAVPGYRAAVLDEKDEPMETGTGRLAVKGPTGCRYLDDERQQSYVVNGWNVTGDAYRRDADGRFWFVSRSDDMIVSSGYNIAAPEVENALYGHAAVSECAVVGMPCPERGSKVKAFIVLADGLEPSDALARTLQDHVKATIAPYKYPREIAFVDTLPKSATGKLQRYLLRSTAEKDGL